MELESSPSGSPSERSEAHEPLSAPSEFLAEFLSAVMRRQHAEALKYCRLILQYEPHNDTARAFYPLLRHKLRRRRDRGGEQPSSSSEGSEACAVGAAGRRGAVLQAEGSVSSQSSLELDSESSSPAAWDSSERSDDNGNVVPRSSPADAANDNAAPSAAAHQARRCRGPGPTLG